MTSAPLAPWYVIAWRLPWYAVAFPVRVLLVTIIFCGWGSATAARLWEETK